FDEFPEHRKRKCIAPFFFCNVLLHKSLFRLPSLSSIGPFLFSSPDVMRALGFQMRQIREGFYSGGGQRPFNEEAMSDFFARCKLPDFLSNQKLVARAILKSCAEITEDGSVILDVIDIRIPAGKNGREEEHLDACVLSCVSQGEALPILWNFVAADTESDLTQGKRLMDEAMPILGGMVKRVIVDRGFISGKWVSDLKQKRSLDMVIRLKSDMILHQDMISLSRHKETKWIWVEPPKYQKGKVPKRRICYLSELELWEECKVPLAGIVIQDIYPDKVEYSTVVTTDLEASIIQIYEWIRSRWAIEEVFMTESRYGCLNQLASCRQSVAAALVHFSLLAYILVKLFVREEEIESKAFRPQIPTSGVEFVAYWKDRYAIIFPSQLIELVARCAPAWGHRLPSIPLSSEPISQRNSMSRGTGT
ncbi:MAG: transposase, partial [Deltaproteobacteria bacterium]|nr:transposase [Deltaproteobacteria bacterium]